MRWRREKTDLVVEIDKGVNRQGSATGKHDYGQPLSKQSRSFMWFCVILSVIEFVGSVSLIAYFFAVKLIYIESYREKYSPLPLAFGFVGVLLVSVCFLVPCGGFRTLALCCRPGYRDAHRSWRCDCAYCVSIGSDS